MTICRNEQTFNRLTDHYKTGSILGIHEKIQIEIELQNKIRNIHKKSLQMRYR